MAAIFDLTLTASLHRLLLFFTKIVKLHSMYFKSQGEHRLMHCEHEIKVMYNLLCYVF